MFEWRDVELLSEPFGTPIATILPGYFEVCPRYLKFRPKLLCGVTGSVLQELKGARDAGHKILSHSVPKTALGRYAYIRREVAAFPIGVCFGTARLRNWDRIEDVEFCATALK